MEIPVDPELWDNKALNIKDITWYNYSSEINASWPFNNLTSRAAGPRPGSIAVLDDIIFALDEFGVPTIVAIGVISNLIVGVTIRNTPLKNVSACCYYLSMSIVDSIYLLAMFVPWISVQWKDIYNSEGFCQLVVYLNLLTTFLSSWFIVMLLLERLFVCYLPTKARRYCSAFRTKCYVAIVAVFSIVGHLYLTWTSGVYVIYGQPMCTVIHENAKDIVIVRKVDTVFSVFLPVLACLILIIAVTANFCFCSQNCEGRSLTFETKRLTFEVRVKSYSFKQTQTTGFGSQQKAKNNLIGFIQSKRLTIVSLIVAFVYVTLFIPHNIIKARITYTTGSYVLTIYDRSFLKLFEELFKINFAYKGILYFTILPEFRQNLLKLILGIRKSTNCKKTKTKRKCDLATSI